tara:strand:- start:307 stop:609 length:303 start_codon:yes stop_codon:yes gene_type:complete
MTALQTTSILLGIIISVSTILSITALGVRWLVKHYFNEIKAQFKPNGGSSLKDQVNRLETRQDMADSVSRETYLKVEKLDRKLEDLYDKFIEYLANNKKK